MDLARLSVRSRHPLVLVVVLCAAGIAVSLMQTLIVPVIPDLPRMLSVGAADASWAITSTLLTAAVATPVFGRLGDMYGPRRMLIVSAVGLTIGSLICALSSTLLPFVIGRGLQGLGMPIIPLGIAVLRAAMPPERVGAAMGTVSSSLGVGAAAGLPLSAIIAEHFDWHMLFWLATGLGAMALMLFVALVPVVPPVSMGRFDPLGTLLLAGGLVTLLLPISKGAGWGWTSVPTLALAAASLVTFALFAVWQLRIESPIVDLRTTVRAPVLLTNLSSICMGFSLFAMSLIAPQILELSTATGYGLGQSLTRTGLWLAPGGLAMMVCASAAGMLAARRGPKFTLVFGSAIIAGGYLGGSWLLGSAALIGLLNVILSIGVGFGFAALPMLINAAVPITETAAANGINALSRSLGTSISSAVIGAILAAMVVSAPGMAHPVPSQSGFHVALYVAGAVALLGAVLAALIPDPVAALDAADARP